ncbi:helix-turn-helix transcriptional regulator [Aurantimonas marianensis]|uniref:Helix-turn-helix transcriptional regulator n=1 Tax=Aurantimonas marianensis TaxID=2920428 RepID=A0A9X2KCV1_9HYPH|nr:helix-turn-helix transcriptional regulator [Aurantimonas marianensis]MCP3053783.1 helix-turn-helix transcriptional regulator [Aurantimonas marianensis]
MKFLDEFERITSVIYEASVAPEDGWQDVSDALSEVFLEAAVVIDDNGIARQDDHFLKTSRFDLERVKTHFERFATAEENSGVRSLLTGPVSRAFDMRSGFEPGEWDRDPSVAAILQPQGITEGQLLVLERNDGRLTDLLIYRGQRGGAFSTKELRLINALAPHLKRALAIRRHLREMTEQMLEAQRLLQNVAGGLIMTDQAGRVIEASGSGRQALDSAAAIYVSQGRIRARHPAADRVLNAMFAGDFARGDEPMRLPGDDGHDYILWEFPASAANGLTDSVNRRVFGINLQAVSKGAPPLDLQRRYGLTQAEGEIAAAFALGASLGEIAEMRGNSVHTVRTHLKSIFAKTGTHRQSQLVALLHAP